MIDNLAFVTLRPFAYIFLQLGKMGQKHEVKKNKTKKKKQNKKKNKTKKKKKKKKKKRGHNAAGGWYAARVPVFDILSKLFRVCFAILCLSIGTKLN